MVWGLAGLVFLILRTVLKKPRPQNKSGDFSFSRGRACLARMDLCLPVSKNVCSGARLLLFAGGFCSGPYAGTLKAPQGPWPGQGGTPPESLPGCIFPVCKMCHNGTTYAWLGSLHGPGCFHKCFKCVLVVPGKVWAFF